MEDGTKKTQSTVAFQQSAKRFTQSLYPSDIKYNFVEGRQDADKFKVYVVYRISVKNNTTHNLPDLYKETALHLTSLTDTFDSYRYELNKDDIGDNAVSREMERWSSNNNIATYNITGSGKKFETGILRDSDNSNNTESTYIQFKVTDQFLGDIAHLSQEEKDKIYEISPSVAGAKGYHMYTRYDKNWKDTKEYNHRTIDKDENSGSIGIDWALADTRKISGVVFEDTKVDQLEGESRKDERIGNGKLDINEDGTYREKTVSGVVVSLMDADATPEKVAKVYNGELVQGADGKWRATSKDAIVLVKDDGSYVMPDVVPGRYYLKFTYGNGKVEYTDINGNKIENIETKINGEKDPIKSYLYKSTILSGAAKNANSGNEKTWFLDSIKEGVNSVAIDDDGVINDRLNDGNKETELNYNYTKNLSSSTISAKSPTMNLQFEYIPDTEIEANLINDPTKAIINDPTKAKPLRTNCEGMSFGIIERPHVNIELEKTIKNIKLTLQNGTTIINGDPQNKNVSTNLSSLDASNAKLELDSSYIYGSNAIVTYALSAHNRSELDYATSDYYKYGTKANDVTPVTTTVTKIVDYLNNQSASYVNQSENSETLNDEKKKEYFSEDVIDKNKNYKQTILSPEKDLLPEVYDSTKSSTDEYEFTINNLLSTSDGILGWESYAEIIGIKNITLTPQSVSNAGNYVIEDKTTFEPDTANATISIYPSTGENKNLIIYYILGGALIIIALGVVLIKKFVIYTK